MVSVATTSRYGVQSCTSPDVLFGDGGVVVRQSGQESINEIASDIIVAKAIIFTAIKVDFLNQYPRQNDHLAGPLTTKHLYGSIVAG
jgi:hypothetical protein